MDVGPGVRGAQAGKEIERFIWDQPVELELARQQRLGRMVSGRNSPATS